MTTFVLAILGQYVPLAVSYLPLGVLAAEGKNCPLQLRGLWCWHLPLV